jgi:sigma-54 specific flagellar transcriptional regulator A
MSCLARNRWPGNVRELANLLERLAILYPDQTIGAEDLPERYRAGGAGSWFEEGVRLAPAPAAPLAVVESRIPTPVRATEQDSCKEDSCKEDSRNGDPCDECGKDWRGESSCSEDSAAGESIAERALLGAPFELGDGAQREPAEQALRSGGIDLKDHLSAIEIGLIRKALAQADGTVAGAARLLRIRRTTLVEKLRKYRLTA